MTSFHGPTRPMRICLPSAAGGCPHTSRAMLLDTIDDRPAIVDIGPREIATGNQRNPQRLEEARRHELGSAQRRDAFGVASCLQRVTAMLFSSSISIGSAVAKAAEVTPETRDLRQDVLLHPRHALGVRETSVSGIEMRSVWICSGPTNPGSTLRSARKVRIIRPDATRSTTARATCTNRSRFCDRCRVRPWLDSAASRRGAEEGLRSFGPGVLHHRHEPEQQR